MDSRVVKHDSSLVGGERRCVRRCEGCATDGNRGTLAILVFQKSHFCYGQLSLGYGIGGPIVTVAMLSLALNLVLTGIFILMVKRLIAGAAEKPGMSVAA